jgi:ubiquinone/menaquinone biosynthesis C-methylase UbiE
MSEMRTRTKTETRGHRWFAATYDITAKLDRGRIEPLRKKVVSDVAGDVVEIGAGTGANFELYGPEARVTAFEPDPHMLKRARNKIPQGTQIELRQASAEAVPCDDASADVVVTTLVLCTVDDLARSLEEARRVLRPGGELRFLEHVRGEGRLGRFHDIVRPGWSWVAAGCHPNRRTEQAIRDSGFEIIEVERTKLGPMLPAIRGVARKPA